MNLTLLFDGHTFDMEPQGTSTFLAGLINALPGVAATHFPHVNLHIHCAASSADNVAIYLKVPYTFHRIKTGFLRRNLVDLPRLSHRIKSDIVVSQYVRPIWVHKHTASVIHDLLFVDFPRQFSAMYCLTRTILFGLSARFSSAIFTVSEYSRQRIADIYKLAPKRIVILANAIPPRLPIPAQAAEPATIGKQVVHLLYVSRLEQRKRQEWCLRALDDLRRVGLDIRLTLVGKGQGDYATEIKQQIAHLTSKHGSAITHLEGISQERLDSVYAQADVFLFPSLGEGFGIPVIEAAAHGIPCVVTDSSALSELSAYYVGQTFRPNDFAQFLAAIRRISEHLDAYRAQSTQNIPKVVNHFTWETTAHSFLQTIIALEK